MTYATEGDFWPEVFKEYGAQIAADVKADAIEAGTVEGEGIAELEAEGQKLAVCVEKVA